VNVKYIALILGVAGATSTAFAAEGSFAKTLNVSGAPSIAVSTGSGYIHVSTGSQSEVRINAKVKTQHGWNFGSHGNEEDRVRDITSNPPIAQNGNTITIGETHGDSSRFRNIEIDYDISLPASTTLKVNSGSGDLDVSNVASVLSADTGSGDIRLNNVGPTPHVVTGSGTIRANGIHGAASLETGSGDIEFHQQIAGDVKAGTGSGSIHLYGVNGGVHVRTGSGDVEIDGNPSTDWKLDTGSGSIHLNLPSDAHYNLNADTGSGSVRVDAPITMQGTLNKQHIVGTIHGGGPTIRVSTGSGDISVH
jgi:DUF4097 and DUF4098 domain-containing protein YvlB